MILSGSSTDGTNAFACCSGSLRYPFARCTPVTQISPSSPMSAIVPSSLRISTFVLYIGLPIGMSSYSPSSFMIVEYTDASLGPYALNI